MFLVGILELHCSLVFLDDLVFVGGLGLAGVGGLVCFVLGSQLLWLFVWLACWLVLGVNVVVWFWWLRTLVGAFIRALFCGCFVVFVGL